jgi:hypothetical protein
LNGSRCIDSSAAVRSGAMSITVSLEPDIEQAIEKKAARLGLTASAYVAQLAERSTKPKPRRVQKVAAIVPNLPASEDRVSAMVHRADPAELKANGITLAEHPANTGAELVHELLSLGVLGSYGDPAIDSPELARQLRERAQLRDWS